MPDLIRTKLGYQDLTGWADDDHAQAVAAYSLTADLLSDAWPKPGNGREWIEAHFTPVLIQDGAPPLFTGYFEPQVNGSRTRSPHFPTPLYRLPPGGCTLSRTQIETGHALEGQELIWVASPVEAFFIQVQGSARICLPDGLYLRVGFAGRNGHPYRSIGRILVDRGVCSADNISADAIRTWVVANGQDGTDLLRENPSFVFFREVTEFPDGPGPIGAMGRPVTPLRTIAVDPDITPLGAMVWIERASAPPQNRLMVAQDTGSAIKGAQRADIFFGSGFEAGTLAGLVKDAGQMIVLLPNDLADLP